MRSALSSYKPVHDMEEVEWVVNACYGPLWTLHRIVPKGFERYLRIFHPAWEWSSIERSSHDSLSVDDFKERDRATPLSWETVAQRTGKKFHRESRWSDISPAQKANTRCGEGGITAPYEGEISVDILDGIFQVLLTGTHENEKCVCAFWEGFGTLDDTQTLRIEGFGQQGHYVMASTLGSVHDQWRNELELAGESAGLTPQAVWPVSKSWLLSVPFELDSSFFGGSSEMATKLCSLSSLEVAEVESDDRFLW